MISKCLFPAAGFGTRFLPATKAVPKEMLPIITKPLLQYGVEEALSAGITNIAIVTGRGKRSIEDHFDSSVELESQLKATSKEYYIKDIQNIIQQATCVNKINFAALCMCNYNFILYVNSCTYVCNTS